MLQCQNHKEVWQCAEIGEVLALYSVHFFDTAIPWCWLFVNFCSYPTRQDILKTCFAMIARLLLLYNMFWVQVAREDQTQYIVHHMRHFWKHVWIQVAREDCQTLNIIWDILKTCFVCRLLAKTRHYTLYIVWDSCIQVAREDCQTLYLYIIHNTLYIAMHFENIFCIQVAREDCQTVPVQKCDSVKDEQCRNVPRKVGIFNSNF